MEPAAGALARQPASPPGVHFTAIALDRVVFFDMQPGAPRPPSLKFVFSISRSPADPSLDVTLALRIEPVGEAETNFGLEAAMTAHFERVEGPNVISIEDFAKVNGPALIVPYLRELVTNLTARSRHGPIIFPTVNVHALVAHEMRAIVGG